MSNHIEQKFGVFDEWIRSIWVNDRSKYQEQKYSASNITAKKEYGNDDYDGKCRHKGQRPTQTIQPFRFCCAF